MPRIQSLLKRLVHAANARFLHALQAEIPCDIHLDHVQEADCSIPADRGEIRLKQGSHHRPAADETTTARSAARPRCSARLRRWRIPLVRSYTWVGKLLNVPPPCQG